MLILFIYCILFCLFLHIFLLSSLLSHDAIFQLAGLSAAPEILARKVSVCRPSPELAPGFSGFKLDFSCETVAPFKFQLEYSVVINEYLLLTAATANPTFGNVQWQLERRRVVMSSEVNERWKSGFKLGSFKPMLTGSRAHVRNIKTKNEGICVIRAQISQSSLLIFVIKLKLLSYFSHVTEFFFF